MKHSLEKRKHKTGYQIRVLLLAVEVVLTALFLWGQGVPCVSTETPQFSWQDRVSIAHALGGIGEYTYLNSKEGFLASYQMGCRLFEVDLTKTSDGIWVCRHNWNQPLGQWDGEEKTVLSAEEFLSRPLYGKYTPMTLEDLLMLLKDYPDAFVLLDSKQYSLRNYQKTIEDYADYLEIARNAGAEEVIDQLIPEIYNQNMFAGAALLYGFPAYIYSLWQEYSIQEIEKIALFCAEKGILAATVSYEYWSEEIQDIFEKHGVQVYVYTVNDPEQAAYYRGQGVAGVCTDYLVDESAVFATGRITDDSKRNE